MSEQAVDVFEPEIRQAEHEYARWELEAALNCPDLNIQSLGVQEPIVYGQSFDDYASYDYSPPVLRLKRENPALCLLNSTNNIRPEFRQKLSLGFGATDSLHQVMFGCLHLQGDQRRTVTDVAVKPFKEAASKRAEHELRCLELLERSGINAFKPIGILSSDRYEFLITEFESQILSLDNVHWGYPLKTAEFHEYLGPMLYGVGESLGELHSKGVFHGDAQIKNFALSESGDTQALDLEGAAYINESDEIIRQLPNMGFGDIVMLYSTLKTQGFLTGETSENNFNTFNAYVLEPYYKTLNCSFSESEIKPRMEDIEGQLIEYILVEDSLGAEQ